TLRRTAGLWSLWALGVGAVISGDFFGWNHGLAAGGFGGLALATAIIALMYTGLVYSIAEMSPALPHTGGAYSFGRTAMGPFGGFVTGLAENMEYVLTPAVVVVAIGGYMSAISTELVGADLPRPLWWLITYGIFLSLNIWGAEITFKFSVVMAMLSLAILVVFWVGAVPLFELDNALNIEPEPGRSRWLPFGINGVAGAMPFAIWFYLAIEQMPLAAEEARDPKRDMPRAILLAWLTLVVASVLTLVLNSGIPGGAREVSATDEPLFLGLRAIFGSGVGASLLGLVAVAGLITSFHTILYAQGRNIYSLSRAGYFPRWLSVTGARRQTPHVALIVGSAIGFTVAVILEYGKDWFQGVPVGAVLLNMAVFGAVIAYIMQLVAFVQLRRKLPDIARPYVSPVGLWGALIACAISAFTLIYLLIDPEIRVGIWGCLVWFALGLIYFAAFARKRLVYAPEEAFAESGGRDGQI
ncbi:MAG: amino acid permease, partial [Deltaproteobacteria bacterium]|nr:amino acid permease [Deltaproteobacteria bacterium]